METGSLIWGGGGGGVKLCSFILLFSTNNKNVTVTLTVSGIVGRPDHVDEVMKRILL